MLTHEELWDIASRNQPIKNEKTGTEYSVTRHDDTIVNYRHPKGCQLLFLASTD